MGWDVYATGWRDDRIIDQLPAHDIEFERAVSEHGKCSFSLPVPRFGAAWLPIVRPFTTGVLVCEDDQVRWGGVVTSRHRSGERTYRIDALEWGTALEDVRFSPAMFVSEDVVDYSRVALIRMIAGAATTRVGADWPLEVQAVDGGSTVTMADDLRAVSLKGVMSVIEDLCEPEGAPEWCLSVEGTAAQPRRVLRVAPRLGRPVSESRISLDFVANYDTAPPVRFPEAGRAWSTLQHLYPTPDEIWMTDDEGRVLPKRRHGGNILTDPGDDMTGAGSATAVWTTHQATDADQTDEPGHARADDLLAAGWPLREVVVAGPAAPTKAARDAYARGILAARRGFTTSWKFSTFASDPDYGAWQPGDDAVVSIESDTYSYAPPGKQIQPIVFTTRLTGASVKPDDNARTSSAVVQYRSVTPAGVLGF
ncbi:hypothetical protein [Arsenicicoccus dermatophilus]|uniref:hypothetical protein n=1 Tax=Arsenicicoccus dermatophilus TaxID=1076331 RepID=UPI001F4CF726|nr:hypothetical protein [Arsenicicoccus dermatophilus]MCH8613476.1 hypothetical protein [Arsenicicoccus dermatophilus]